MDGVVRDVRYALATMRRDRGYAAAAILTLALGIGATTAVFSVVYGVLMRPLPYADSGRLVRLFEEHPGAPRPPGDPQLSNTTLYAWRDRLQTLDGIAAYYAREYTVALGGNATRVHGAEVSPSLFGLLGATPALGRFLRAGDDARNANRFVVIGDRLWREHLAGAADVIGRTLTIEGTAHEVVGVAPPGLGFPDHDTQLWTPYDDPTLADPSVQGGMWLSQALGRLKFGVSRGQAEAEGTAIAQSVKRPSVANLLFGVGGPVRVHVETLAGQMTSAVRPVLILVAASVGLVLLVACGNVANLFLARGLARHRELTLRTAIGASRQRLIQQLLTESAVLSVLAGVLGLLIGWSAVRLLPLLTPKGFPRLDDIRVDTTVGIFCALISVASALASGLMPAIRGARFDLATSLRGGDGAIAGGFRGPRARRLRDTLLATEAALAVLLLVGALLLGRSLMQLTRVDAGYTPNNVLIARVYPPSGMSRARNSAFVDELVSRLQADRGVVAVGAGNMMPFSDSTWITAFEVPPEFGGGKPSKVRAVAYVATPGYAQALGLRVREGRFLRAVDRGREPVAMVVNHEFLRQYLGAGSPVGRTLPGGPFRHVGATQIIGVVDDVLKDGNDTRSQPEVYVLEQPDRPIGDEVDLVARAIGDPASLLAVIRADVRAVDPEAAVGEALPLTLRVSASVDQPRFATAVVGALAVLATVLASIGLYGVLSYTVSQRRHEFGLRTALGAARGDLVRLVLRDGLGVTLVGLIVGLAAAALCSRLMTALLFAVTPLDLRAYAGASVVLIPVALAACLAPALRAAATDPVIALREP
jgi:putative ABC transport system permease protein